MTNQLNIFEQDLGKELRDAGIAQSEKHANEEIPGWSDMAFGFLISFLERNSHEFMVEDVRKEAEGIVPYSHTERAWGSVILKASRRGLVKHLGYKQVDNPNAHKTPASVWQKV